jgi:hypothetical protein
MSPSELLEMESELEDTVGGPIDMHSRVIAAAYNSIAASQLAPIRELEIAFDEAMVAQGAEPILVEVYAVQDGYAVDAAVIRSGHEQIGDATLTAVQGDLSELVEAPVRLEVIFLPGNFTSVSTEGEVTGNGHDPDKAPSGDPAPQSPTPGSTPALTPQPPSSTPPAT